MRQRKWLRAVVILIIASMLISSVLFGIGTVFF
ncbi:MAG: stressosome-associated protein Prli42 [Bacilli bacterium]